MEYQVAVSDSWQASIGTLVRLEDGELALYRQHPPEIIFTSDSRENALRHLESTAEEFYQMRRASYYVELLKDGKPTGTSVSR